MAATPSTDPAVRGRQNGQDSQSGQDRQDHRNGRDRLQERFDLIVNGPALFNALVSGLDFDVFGFLSRSPGATLDDLARATALGSHQLRVLMHGLCATELVERHDGRYTNSAVAEDLLVPDGPDSWRDILAGWQQIYYPAFPEMTEALRTARNTALDAHPGTEPTLYARLSHRPELEATLHRSMGAFTRQTLPGLLEHPVLASVTHLLDVGGGDGITARSVLERHPGTTVTILDLPSVAALAAEQTPPELAPRLRTHGCDIFADPFPTGVDAVSFSHVLEVFSADEIGRLLAKAHAALPEGGKVLIYGFDIPDEENAGVFSARLSLYLNVLATGQGMTYPARDYAGWLTGAGFRAVESVRGLPYEHALVIGTK